MLDTSKDSEDKMKLTQTVVSTLRMLSVLPLFCHARNLQVTENGPRVPAIARILEKLQQIRTGPGTLWGRSAEGVEIAVRTIEQKVDHFNESDARTWQMRYMVRSEFFQPGGPLFVWIAYYFFLETNLIDGAFFDLAKIHNAYLINIEHRYYGESLPTNFTKENYKYFNAQQALADIAHLIRTLKATVPGLANSKVIMAGGSYPGALLVWFKKLYPDLMDGGWSSSAPLLAKVDFKEFAEVLGKAYRSLGGQKCYERIQNGIAQLESEIVGANSTVLKATMNFCDSFDEKNELDVSVFFASVMHIFHSFINTGGRHAIESMCEELEAYPNDLSAILAVITKYIAESDDNNRNYCYETSFNVTVEYYTIPEYNPNRSWLFQICNEFGWFGTSTSTEQPFGTKFPLEFFIALCSQAFGPEYTKEYIHQRVEQTNALFGGKNVDVQNIYFTQGAWDPWSTVGRNASQGATVISDAVHCSDLHAVSDSDNAEMRASKEKVAQLILDWISV